MKVKKWIPVVIMTVLASGFVFGEAQQGEQPEGAQVRQRARAATAARMRTTEARDRLYQERLTQLSDAHAAEIKELLTIQALAEEENATKTVAAIQALIEKKNAAHQQQVKTQEQTRRERLERLQQRMQERGQGQAVPRPQRRALPNTGQGARDDANAGD